MQRLAKPPPDISANCPRVRIRPENLIVHDDVKGQAARGSMISV